MNKKVNDNTEKLTININHVDLGKIDILVENGFFTNRTDFIRNAIRKNLTEYDSYVNEVIEKDSYFLGIFKLGNSELRKYKERNLKQNIKVVGLLVMAKDIDVDLLKETVSSIKVKGIVVCDKAIKGYYGI
jgi:Arc/MetJ-type ribon-helix-helix transcriptional regulator